MAAVLERVSPLADLLGQADDPPATAALLCELALSSAHADAVVAAMSAAVVDRMLVRPTLRHCGALTAADMLDARAAVLFGQAGVLLESRAAAGFELVLTVPAFLRAPLAAYVTEHGDAARPLETARAVRETAAGAGQRLQVAAPYLHAAFVGLLVPDVQRVLAGGGHVQLITRGLSPAGPASGGANRDAVALLRDAAAGAPGRLEVVSWEEAGLGVHLKVVLAHRVNGSRVAYIGSSNLTPGGTLAHAEAGVLARGPQVDLLAHWLDLTAAELSRRRLPGA